MAYYIAVDFRSESANRCEKLVLVRSEAVKSHSQTYMRIKPPEFLFHLPPGLEWKFLLRRTWLGQNCSHCSFLSFHSISKDNQVSLVRALLSAPGSKSRIGRLGVWVWKDDPDYIARLRKLSVGLRRVVPCKGSVLETPRKQWL